MHKILIDSFNDVNYTHFNNEYVLMPQLFNLYFGKYSQYIHTEKDLSNIISSYYEFFKFYKKTMKYNDYARLSAVTNQITKTEELLFDDLLTETFYKDFLKTMCILKKDQIQNINFLSNTEIVNFVKKLIESKEISTYIDSCFENILIFLQKWEEVLGGDLKKQIINKVHNSSSLIKQPLVKNILSILLTINEYCGEINLNTILSFKNLIDIFSDLLGVSDMSLAEEIKLEKLIDIEHISHRSHFGNVSIIVDSLFNNDITQAILSDNPYEYLARCWLEKIEPSHINEDSFTYLSKDLMVIKEAMTTQLNFKVLIYGIAGTGKTEFSSVISQITNKTLYRIKLNDFKNTYSLKAEEYVFHKLNQMCSFASLFKGNDFILVFDECEEIFENNTKFKEKLTNFLEELELPSIFIANDITKFHQAYLRRFSYHLNIDICDFNQKIFIINNYIKSNNLDSSLYSKEIIEYIAIQSITNADLQDNISFYNSTKNFNFLRQKVENKQITQDLMKLNTVEQSMYNFISPENNHYNFDHVVGYKEEKKLLLGLHHYLNNKIKYQELKINIHHGSILFGSPGTGKTSIIKALANHCHIPLLNVSTGMMTNDESGALHIKKIFNLAKKNSPCIVLLDEFEKMALNRNLEIKNGTSQNLMNQLLIEMDLLHNSNLDVFIYATCNTIDYIDPAISRSGRLEQMIEIGLPPAATREKMLINLLGKKCKVTNLKQIVAHTTGLSFVDLQSIVNTYKISLLQNGKKANKQALLFKAIHDFSLGKISNTSLEQEEKQLVAYHESGHAFLAYLFNKSVGNISIIPKSGSLGTTMVLHDELKNLNTKDDIEHELMILMAGRAAENVFLSKETNGSSNDFDRATHLVMRNLFILAKDTLGLRYANLLTYDTHLSENYKVKVEETINTILLSLYEKTKKILINGKEEVESLVKILMLNEQMIQPEMELILVDSMEARQSTKSTILNIKNI